MGQSAAEKQAFGQININFQDVFKMIMRLNKDVSRLIRASTDSLRNSTLNLTIITQLLSWRYSDKEQVDALKTEVAELRKIVEALQSKQ